MKFWKTIELRTIKVGNKFLENRWNFWGGNGPIKKEIFAQI